MVPRYSKTTVNRYCCYLAQPRPIWKTCVCTTECIYNMCASVHTDFCRPKGLESAQPDLAPTQYGTIEIAINYWCMGKTQYYSQCGKIIRLLYHSRWQYWMYWMSSHCGSLSHWHYRIGTHTYPDYRQAWQAVFSVVYMSVIMVSMNPVNNWIQSNATSKVRMGLASWLRRRTRLGRSRSQLMSWQPSQCIWIETNFNSKAF